MILSSALLAYACSDDGPGEGAGSGGSGGASGASAGTAGSGGGNAGSAGSAGAGTAGSAGAAGTAGAAGSAGSAGSAGAAGAGVDAGPDGADAAVGTFSVGSPAFDNNPGCGPGAPANAACDLFPAENTNLNGAANTSPEIRWTGVPEGTQSFAIALHDLSNLQGNDPFTHWVMWNIPSTETGLPASLPTGAMPGTPSADTQQASFAGNEGYTGSGQCGNVYEFVLYALSAPTFTPSGDATNQDGVQAEIEASDSVLGIARMRARSNPNVGQNCT
jgi:Raf kinase inhibitor-like YbhB/YbcL family protein